MPAEVCPLTNSACRTDCYFLRDAGCAIVLSPLWTAQNGEKLDQIVARLDSLEKAVHQLSRSIQN